MQSVSYARQAATARTIIQAEALYPVAILFSRAERAARRVVVDNFRRHVRHCPESGADHTLDFLVTQQQHRVFLGRHVPADVARKTPDDGGIRHLADYHRCGCFAGRGDFELMGLANS